jgi:putative tricarboxylic transport membrane protein
VTRAKELFPYALLLVAGAYLYYRAGEFAAFARPGELGPETWPKAILGLLMLVCAGEIAWRALWMRLGARETAHPVEAAGAEEEKRYPARLVAGAILTILYVPGLEVLGFFLCTALYLAAFMVIGRYSAWRVIALSSVVGSLAFVYVFMKIVYVSLPLGIGPFRSLSTAILALLGIH